MTQSPESDAPASEYPASEYEVRMMVLEMTVAAMVAQLPLDARQEVVGMLTFVAGAAEAAEDLFPGSGEDAQVRQVSHWAQAMLDRAMNSRRSQRPPPPEGDLVFSP